LNTSAPPVVAVPTNKEDDNREEEEAGKCSPARERKKRKRSVATDEIEALFNDVIGRKVVRGALDPAPVPVRASPKSTTKAKEGEGQSESEERVEVHADLGAIVDAIRVTPSGEDRLLLLLLQVYRQIAIVHQDMSYFSRSRIGSLT